MHGVTMNIKICYLTDMRTRSMKPTEMSQGRDELWAYTNTARNLKDLQNNITVE
jgi:hypothetical protein